MEHHYKKLHEKAIKYSGELGFSGRDGTTRNNEYTKGSLYRYVNTYLYEDNAKHYKKGGLISRNFLRNVFSK